MLVNYYSSDSLHHSITVLVDDLDSLVRDLKENPEGLCSNFCFRKIEEVDLFDHYYSFWGPIFRCMKRQGIKPKIELEMLKV